MIDLDEERFAELVDDAFALIPAELTELLDNVVLFIEADPPANDPHLLGFYDGIPLTERGMNYAGTLPDRIFVFRNPILRMCRDEQDVRREVAITVIHEIAHHFGIEDDRLHELGYG